MNRVSVVVSVATVGHVGHMEQHPGPQEAAGLTAGEAAEAAERPDATLYRYARTIYVLYSGQVQRIMKLSFAV